MTEMDAVYSGRMNLIYLNLLSLLVIGGLSSQLPQTCSPIGFTRFEEPGIFYRPLLYRTIRWQDGQYLVFDFYGKCKVQLGSISLWKAGSCKFGINIMFLKGGQWTPAERLPYFQLDSGGMTNLSFLKEATSPFRLTLTIDAKNWCRMGRYGANAEVGFAMADVNECENNNTSDVCNSFNKRGVQCYNTDGSFICSCKSGYGGPQCFQDIDECLTANHRCEQPTPLCRNIVGSYECTSTEGSLPGLNFSKGAPATTSHTPNVTRLPQIGGNSSLPTILCVVLVVVVVGSLLVVAWMWRRMAALTKALETSQRSGHHRSPDVRMPSAGQTQDAPSTPAYETSHAGEPMPPYSALQMDTTCVYFAGIPREVSAPNNDYCEAGINIRLIAGENTPGHLRSTDDEDGHTHSSVTAGLPCNASGGYDFEPGVHLGSSSTHSASQANNAWGYSYAAHIDRATCPGSATSGACSARTCASRILQGESSTEDQSQSQSEEHRLNSRTGRSSAHQKFGHHTPSLNELASHSLPAVADAHPVKDPFLPEKSTNRRQPPLTMQPSHPVEEHRYDCPDSVRPKNELAPAHAPFTASEYLDPRDL